MLGPLIIAILQGYGKNFIQVDFQSLLMSGIHTFFFYMFLCWVWYLLGIGKVDIMVFDVMGSFCGFFLTHTLFRD